MLLQANQSYVTTALGLNTNQATTYNASEVSTTLGLKASQSTTYTQTEVYSALHTQLHTTCVDGQMR